MKNSFKSAAAALILICAGAGWAAAAEIPTEHSMEKALGVVEVIDGNEIKAAQLAESKEVNHRIKDYARMLIDEHGKNMEKTQDLAKDLGVTVDHHSHAADQLRDKGQEELAELRPLEGNAFARLYIEDMVKGHTEALAWIDREIHESHHERFRHFMQETSEHVAKHLERAQAIRRHQERK